MTRAKFLLWLALAIPAALLLLAQASAPGADFEELLHPSGETSARLLVVALALTPLARLLPGRNWLRWLMGQRRAIGVAAFGYAALHTAFYIIAMGTLDDMLAEIGAKGIWTGWLALALLLPLALTSNAAAMRALGRGWKRLQRLAYPAALLTFAHWVFVHNGLTGALLHFVPLALLEAKRLRGSTPRFFPQRGPAR